VNQAAEDVTRIIMGNVPDWMAYAFYAAVSVACLWAAGKILLRFLKHRQGRDDSSRKHERQTASLGSRLLEVVKYVTFHRQLLRDRYAGIAHVLLFYGFTILFIGTCLVFLEYDTPLHFFYGRFYLAASLVIDLGGVAFLAGLLMFLYRRTVGDSSRILRRVDVASCLWLLLAIGLTGFFLEGARIAVDRPTFERWSIVGYSIAVCLNSWGVAGETALRWHRFLWGFHAVLCIAFFALLPWRFFSHMVFAPVAWALRTRRPRLTLRAVELASPDPMAQEASPPGATDWQRLPWVDLLQADACTTCGRCNSVCPAHAAEKPLRPRDIVLGIREAMDHPNRSFSDLIEDDAIWSCTTCGACNEACPVGIEVYDKIIELRRGYVESGRVPERAARQFESIAENFNPYERPNDARMNWAAGMNIPVAGDSEPIELLYWVGCAGSFDPDGQKVSRAMVKILNHLDIPYRVLGKRERCTGDPARRMGEEGLFQELARANIEMLEAHGVARVLTHCPHCFNVFQNEYPQLKDISFTVEHHSQFLAQLIDDGKLSLAGELNEKITFHDPCYLARGNNGADAPRKILASLPMVENVEMPRNRSNSSCCGAGGGSLWLDVKGNDRIEHQRAKEAAQTGANLVVTGCPFCKTMLEAGRQSFDNDITDIVDLAELVVSAEGL
jgi:Fe-S oxidoreductase/nitrate reductase gamma subunit